MPIDGFRDPRLTNSQVSAHDGGINAAREHHRDTHEPLMINACPHQREVRQAAKVSGWNAEDRLAPGRQFPRRPVRPVCHRASPARGNPDADARLRRPGRPGVDVHLEQAVATARQHVPRCERRRHHRRHLKSEWAGGSVPAEPGQGSADDGVVDGDAMGVGVGPAPVGVGAVGEQDHDHLLGRYDKQAGPGEAGVAEARW